MTGMSNSLCLSSYPNENFSHRRVESVLNGSTNPTNNCSNNSDSSRLEDREYYNDLPGKIPPDLPLTDTGDKTSKESLGNRQPTAAPRNCLKKLSSSEQNGPNLIDLSVDIAHEQTVSDNTGAQTEEQECVKSEHHYVNCSAEESAKNQSIASDTQPECPHPTSAFKDPFDMRMSHLIKSVESVFIEFLFQSHLLALWYRSHLIRSIAQLPALHKPRLVLTLN